MCNSCHHKSNKVICADCKKLRTHSGHGLCGSCYIHSGYSKPSRRKQIKCRKCKRWKNHAAKGLCHACWTKQKPLRICANCGEKKLLVTKKLCTKCYKRQNLMICKECNKLKPHAQHEMCSNCSKKMQAPTIERVDTNFLRKCECCGDIVNYYLRKGLCNRCRR